MITENILHRLRPSAQHFLRNLLTLCGCLVVALFALTGCANPGSGPDGGPYDETPPRIIGMSPMIGEKNAHPKKVTLLFDELIRLENPSEKVIVSPPQIDMPEIKTIGRKISITLLDSLKKNTTYTIDFSDAIEDNNESNPMGQFTYFFSTGENVDTMEVSGNVLNASDLEPIKGILVGLYSDTTDSAFTTKPFDRVARTDGNGRFTIKGVANGKYRIYALKDMDGNFMLNPGEMLAYSRELIVPSSFRDTRHDTVWRDTIHYDTIKAVKFTHFQPDDIVLRAFQPKRMERYFIKTQRDEPEWFRTFFTAPSAHVPTVKGLNFDETDAFLEERSEGNDTITYWLRDFEHFPSVDTLQFAYTYECYDDSTKQNAFRTDTFELIPRHTLAKRLKDKEKNLEKWEKKREKRHKRGDFSQEVPPTEHLAFEKVKTGTLSPTQNVHITFAEPLQRFDTAGIHLFRMQDTLRFEAPFLFERDSCKLTNYTLKGEWRPGQKYALELDSATFMGISGKTTDKKKSTITIPAMEDYGALFLYLPDADTSAVVQILNNGKPERQAHIKDGRVDFFYMKPGSVYLRLFYDRNGNGLWDTGNYEEDEQPEEVYYFPAEIKIRANWDIEQTWTVHQLPLTDQKPKALIKQKENTKKVNPHQKNLDRERERGRR